MERSHHFSSTVNFADVAHGTLIFDRSSNIDSLILKLIDCSWVQRLRRVSQTGNTKFVYNFAEHSRFGHSLGTAYLSSLLLKHLKQTNPSVTDEFELAVAATAVLHDVGHLAPGSHLAEYLWSTIEAVSHESLTKRVILEDPEIQSLLNQCKEGLSSQVISILTNDSSAPPWARSLISGGGWNVDRGNWSIVDSVMCAVSYGRYNVTALIDAFRISPNGELVIQESRLDALTHFFVARNSMYRQVYQHRVLQTADEMTLSLIRAIRDSTKDLKSSIFMDSTMSSMLESHNYAKDLPLTTLFLVDESWWGYHLSQWCESEDSIVSDLAKRLRDRHLFKTITLKVEDSNLSQEAKETIDEAKKECLKQGFPPKHYCLLVNKKDYHKSKDESAPLVLRESGEICEASMVEPLISMLSDKGKSSRAWLSVPKEVKNALGIRR